MGGGYNNFMSKKSFHPASQANQRRKQEAEEKAAAKRKLEEERIAQYRKEQELLDQRSLISKESKDKLSLSFMYNPPPGTSGAADNNNSGKHERAVVKKKRDEGETLKWRREPSVKQEKAETLETLGVDGSGRQAYKKARRGASSSSSCSSDEEISLTWTRTEPKAKKKIKSER